MQFIQKLLPVGARRSGLPIEKIRYIVAHDTGNDGTTALTNVNYYTDSYNYEQASAHFFVDDQYVVNCIPASEKAWHVHYSAGIAPNIEGSFMNDCALGIELCFSRNWGGRNMAAYVNYVGLIASLCVKNGLDPKTAVLSHSQLDPSRRTDPQNAFKYIGKTWPMFIADISAAMVPLLPVPIMPVKAPKFAQALNYTQRAPAVVVLQEFLRSLKLFTFPTSTGYYGDATYAAVAAFQSKNGLLVTGQFDEATRQKANSMAK